MCYNANDSLLCEKKCVMNNDLCKTGIVYIFNQGEARSDNRQFSVKSDEQVMFPLWSCGFALSITNLAFGGIE